MKTVILDTLPAGTAAHEMATIRAEEPDLYHALDHMVDEIGACWTRAAYRRIRAEHAATLDTLKARYPAVHDSILRSLKSCRRRCR